MLSYFSADSTRLNFSRPGEWLSEHGINIVVIIVGSIILRKVFVTIVIGIFNRVLRNHPFDYDTDRKKRIKTLDSLLNAISKIAVLAIATVMIIDELGINTGPLLASAGVLGVAFGFGAQSLIKDFTNGIFIIVENQYRVGDFVELNMVSGVVQAITIRTTILKDFDGNVHHIPNSTITVATNMTYGASGINQDINVDIDTDLDLLEKIINKVGQEIADDENLKPKIKKAPYFAQVVQFNEKGVVVKILGETAPGSQWKVKTELIRRLQTEFIKNGIELPLAPRSSKTVKKQKSKATKK